MEWYGQMLERHLKHWVNTAYRGRLKFIEPAYGSSVGLPDIEVPMGKLLLPIELKIGTLTNSGFLNVELRPSQMRYHILAAESGQPTGIMAAVGAATKFDVYLFAGKHVEGHKYKDKAQLIANWQRWTDMFDEYALNIVFNNIMREYE